MTFEQWLIEHGYRESTRVQTLRAISSLRRDFSEAELQAALKRSAKSRTALRRYATFLAAVPAIGEGPFTKAVRALGLEPVHDMNKKVSKFETVRFEDGDWDKLRKVIELEGPQPERIVLAVMMAGGYRVGDVLRIEKATLQKGLQTGVLELEVKGGRKVRVGIEGAREAWELLAKHWKTGRNVAEWVSPKGGGDSSADGGAYKCVSRFLKKTAAQLGLDGRVNTHRVRHTIAQQALDLTEDIHAVQNLLYHKHLSSTQHYTKGERIEAVTEIQKKLRERGR